MTICKQKLNGCCNVSTAYPNIRAIIQHYESVYDTHNTFCIEFSTNVPLIYDALQGSIYAVFRFLSPKGTLLALSLSHSAKPSGITAKIMFKNCTLWSLPQLTAQQSVCVYVPSHSLGSKVTQSLLDFTFLNDFMWWRFHFCDILHIVLFIELQDWECVLVLPMTDILLRMLLKSRMARSVYVTALPSSCVVTVPGVRERNTKPKLRAAVTIAPSSGDWALYSSSPSGSERQRQQARKTTRKRTDNQIK